MLQCHGIATPLTSYYEHNKLTKLETILAALEQQDVALISEASMPDVALATIDELDLLELHTSAVTRRAHHEAVRR